MSESSYKDNTFCFDFTNLLMFISKSYFELFTQGIIKVFMNICLVTLLEISVLCTLIDEQMNPYYKYFATP